ncbi:beta strand repeat-containing protein [Synoicihabitans lomoniglobus]|uniref:PEPxxWA-CTERM sorting domain-containing protein n=1 Tax=Synoicihabitans lomoniglobus TaxID=2909285 RepID=A0AAF0CPS6_9BACT|nr:PEPxxWA-CTERM sorting domain-containing protein [Opitutaceae bacterium LMO-M01]WED65814.1 PEPxxWA-CTERM sorting domain-containing protein [Opitutaceae bacterium LMO-M01]
MLRSHRWLVFPSILCSSTLLGTPAPDVEYEDNGLTWTNNGAWSSGNIPGPSDTAIINSGTLTVDGVNSTGRLRLGGGNLTGETHSDTDSLSLIAAGANSQWTVGAISDLSLIIGTEAGLDIEGTSIHYYFDSTITNNGAVYWSEGNIATNANGAFINNGYFYDQTVANYSIDGASTFTNNGSYYKSGSGVTTANQVFDNNSAETLQVSNGVFLLNGGGTNSDGAVMRVTQSGLIKFAGSYTIVNASDLEVGNAENENELDGTNAFYLPHSEETVDYGYELSAGELNLSGQLAANLHQSGGELEGTHTINGFFDWAGGDWDANADGATTTIGYDGTLIIRPSGGSIAYFNNRDIINEGTVYWTDANLNTNANGSFTNSGYFYDKLDENQSFNGGAGFNNAGTYLKTGTGTTTFNAPFSNNSVDTLDVRAGTIVFNGGGTNWNDGSVVVEDSGLIQFNSIYTVEDASRFSTESLDGSHSFVVPAIDDLSVYFGYQLTGGELTLEGVLSAQMQQTGGELDGTHTLSGNYDWAGGDWDANADGATTTIGYGGTLIIRPSGGSIAYFNNRDIINYGDVYWTDANLNTNANGSFTNYGFFYDQLDENQSVNGGSGFHNSGTYRKTGAGITTFNSAFNNSSPTTLDVRNGTLVLNGGGTNYSYGSMYARDAGLIQFNSIYSILNASGLQTSELDESHRFFIPNSEASIAYGYKLTGGELTMDGNLSVNFHQTGGELDGTHTLNGFYDWAGGDWDANADGETTTINYDGTLIIRPSGGSIAYFNNRDIVNLGTVYWSDANLNTNANGSFTNYGYFYDVLDENQSFNGGSSFDNSGTYQKTGAGTTTFNTAFNNSSPTTLDVQNGTLILSGGGTNTSYGSMIARDSGLIQFNSNYNIVDASQLQTDDLDGTHSFDVTDETSTSFGYQLTSGELTMDGEISVDFQQTGGELHGTNTLSGIYDWAGGYWVASVDGDTTTIDSEGTLIIRPSGGSIAYFFNRDIINEGTVYWADANLNTNSNGSFSNLGTFNDQLDQNHAFSGGSGFTNSGFYHKDGSGTTDIQTSFVHEGTLNLNAGVMQLSGSGSIDEYSIVNLGDQTKLSLISDFSIANLGSFYGNGTLAIEGGTTSAEGSFYAGELLLANGVLVGNHDIGSTMAWQWGTWGAGTTTIGSTAVLNITGLGTHTMSDRHVVNDGTINWLSSGGGLGLNHASTITNNGLFNDNLTLEYPSGEIVFTSMGGLGSFTNSSSGTYRKSGGSSSIYLIPFHNHGTIDVDAGYLSLVGGGTFGSTSSVTVAEQSSLQFVSDYVVEDAASLQGSGQYLIGNESTVSLTGTISAEGGMIVSDSTLTGDHDIESALTFYESSWESGESTVSSTGQLHFTSSAESASPNKLVQRTVTASGSTVWDANDLQLNSDSSFSNQGTFSDEAAANSTDTVSIYTALGNAGLFTNTSSGTYTKTSSGTTEMAVLFNNDGMVDIQSGALLIMHGGTASSTGVFKVATSSELHFNDDYILDDLASLTGDGNYFIDGGELTTSGILSGNLTTNGGDINGPVTVAGQLILNTGGLVEGNDLTVGTTGSLFVNESSDIFLDDMTLTVESFGYVQWNAADIYLTDTAQIINHGEISITTPISIAPGDSIAAQTLVNNGTLAKTYGSGRTTIAVPLENNGTIDIENGVLVLTADATLASGSAVKLGYGDLYIPPATFETAVVIEEPRSEEYFDDHELVIAGGTTTAPDASIFEGDGLLVVEGGTLEIEGNLAVDLVLEDGTLDTTGLEIARGLEIYGGSIASGSKISVLAEAEALIETATLELTSSTITIESGALLDWTAGDIDTLGNDSGFIIDGLMTAQSDNTLSNDLGSGGFLVINGDFRKTGGTGTTTLDVHVAVDGGRFEVHTGTVDLIDSGGFNSALFDVWAGATLNFDNPSGLFIFGDADTTFQNGGTVNFNAGTFSVPDAINFGQHATLSGGSLLTNTDFALSGNLTWTGGSINSDSTVITTAGTLELANSVTNAVDTDFTVEGTLAWTAGDIAVTGGLTIAESGQFRIETDGTFSSVESTYAIASDGAVIKTETSGITNFNVPLNAKGYLEVQTGTMNLNAGGSLKDATVDIWSDSTLNINDGFNFDNGVVVTNGGNLNLTAGTFTLNDSVNLGAHATVSGGTVAGTHSITGRINMTGGTLDSAGTTTIDADGSLGLANPSGNTINREINVSADGELAWNTGDLNLSVPLDLDGDLTIGTDGTLANTGSAEIYVGSTGAIVKTGGSGTTTIDVPVINHGTLLAESGTLHFGSTVDMMGTLALGSGTITFASPIEFGTSSKLAGNGTFTGDVEIKGAIAPGNSVGSLNIVGDLTLASSANSLFEIDTAASPIQADLVSVSGNLTLDGNLSLDFLASVDPITTDMFTIYTAANLTGTFANIANGNRLYTADLQRSFVVNYGASSVFDANSVILSNFEFTPVPEPSTWALMITGLSLIGWKTRRRRRS